MREKATKAGEICSEELVYLDTDAILETGIQVHYNVKIGEDIKLDELRKSI